MTPSPLKMPRARRWRFNTTRHKPVKELREQIEEIQGKLDRYYGAFENGTLNPDDMSDRVKALKINHKQPFSLNWTSVALSRNCLRT